MQAGRERRVLTPVQAAALFGCLDLREQVVSRLATWEGMRPGEILGLQLEDLDDDSLWVRRHLYRGDLNDPKDDRSARQVSADNWNEVSSRFVGSATANRIETQVGVSFGERYAHASR